VPFASLPDRQPPPEEFQRALEAFARHDAAKNRHLDLLRRLRAANRQNQELRETMSRLLEHDRSAHWEMGALRSAVSTYAVTLRSAGVMPERVLVIVSEALDDIMSHLPLTERPHDGGELRTDLRQAAINAYFAA
jgi:hypothetical protein